MDTAVTYFEDFRTTSEYEKTDSSFPSAEIIRRYLVIPGAMARQNTSVSDRKEHDS